LVGATVAAVHVPTGTQYGTITNADGRYNVVGMRIGGPYKIEISYVGYQKAVFNDVQLQLGSNYVLDATLQESSEQIAEIVVSTSSTSNMKSDRAGAITSVNKDAINAMPTITRSMNDIMRLSPQSSTTSNGYAVGGGNYR
jgi:hypothetical protein